MLAATRFHYWKRHIVQTLIFSTLIGIGIGGSLATPQGQQGASFALDKAEDLTIGTTDNRVHIYAMAIDTFLDTPLIGHGIGSFQRAFQEEKVHYIEKTGRNVGNQRFSHPHNELLFWAIEGGSIAVVAILCAALAVALQLKKLGVQRGGAIAALLVPIAAHTQVELPFYISTLHWIVLLALLAYAFSVRSESKSVSLSGGMTSTVRLSSIALPFVATVFLANSLLAQTGIMQYLKGRGATPAHLNAALQNIYFRETADYFLMRATLQYGIAKGEAKIIDNFINWSRGFLQQIPDIQIFLDQARAFEALGNRPQALETLDNALSIYPGYKPYVDLKDRMASQATN